MRSGSAESSDSKAGALHDAAVRVGAYHAGERVRQVVIPGHVDHGTAQAIGHAGDDVSNRFVVRASLVPGRIVEQRNVLANVADEQRQIDVRIVNEVQHAVQSPPVVVNVSEDDDATRRPGHVVGGSSASLTNSAHRP